MHNGTDGYWAPELAQRRPFIGPEVDCWSLGVTLFAMATRRLPFNKASETYAEDLVKARFVVPPSVSPDRRSHFEIQDRR